MLHPNEKYAGVIKNTLIPDVEVGKAACIQVTIETAEGDIDHRLYLSPDARGRTEKVLLELGLENAHLASEEFWETPEKWMDGLACHIETKEEEYNGSKRVRVKWLNGPRREVKKMAPERARGLAGLFQRANYDAPTPPPAGGTDDVPF